ncbi:MAG: diacylglycerol/lipid kinase family protein [Caulobacteraceae bacterium]
MNAASGSVGANASARLEQIISSFGLDAHIRNAQPNEIESAIRAAVDAKPDLLIVLAGDGTAALAAELCGMSGPLLAPLPGGTMNMLPHALYGKRGWEEALRVTLAEGVARTISGGEVDGRRFHCAAILGAPALWANAREAVRKRKFRLAFLAARRALSRAFTGSLRYRLNGQLRHKTEALSLLCPLVSSVMKDEQALEVAALDPRGAADAFRLGFRTLFGGWRQDPCVAIELCTEGRAWARGRIPVILDGEPHRVESPVTFRFVPEGFRALVPPETAAETLAAEKVGDESGAAAAAGTAASQAVKSL